MSKSSPVPVRLEKDEKKVIKVLAKQSGLSVSEVLRRAVRYAAPRFLSGEAPLGLQPIAAAKKGGR